MTLDEVIDYYGSGYALAKTLRINPQNISYWKKNDGLIPYKHQVRIEHLTDGQLKAEFNSSHAVDRRYNPFYIDCPHCNQPIDLDLKHKRLNKMELKQRGINHGD